MEHDALAKMGHLLEHIRHLAHRAFEDRFFLAEYALGTKEFLIRLFATDGILQEGNST
jgi:hypothetical protein